jgi:hypothetical protein
MIKYQNNLKALNTYKIQTLIFINSNISTIIRYNSNKTLIDMQIEIEKLTQYKHLNIKHINSNITDQEELFNHLIITLTDYNGILSISLLVTKFMSIILTNKPNSYENIDYLKE